MPVMQPQYRTVAAGGMAGAIMTIIAYVLAHFHVVLPNDVVEAATFLITAAAAWIVHPKTPTQPATDIPAPQGAAS